MSYLVFLHLGSHGPLVGVDLIGLSLDLFVHKCLDFVSFSHLLDNCLVSELLQLSVVIKCSRKDLRASSLKVLPEHRVTRFKF